MRGLLKNLPSVPGLILQSLLYGADTLDLEDKLAAARDELHDARSRGTNVNVKLAAVTRDLAEIRAKLAEVHDAAQYDDITTVRAVEMLAEHRDTILAIGQRCHDRHLEAEDDLDVVLAQRSALWTLLKRAARMYRAEIEHAKAIAALLDHCTRERDAARTAIMGLSAHLLRRTVELGKANAELEQLRAELAHARQQEQGRPANGATVTLRLENGKTLTGKVHNGMVNGWHTTAAGRSWVPAPDGGEHRG